MFEGQIMTTTETLVVVQCYKCQCYFAMPIDLKRRAREDNSIGFFCPHGHEQSYVKSKYQEMKDEVERLKIVSMNLASTIDNKNHQITQLNYSVRAQKAAKTKILNRVKNGVCPCCQRTFLDLQKHFKTKHPELIESPDK